MVCQVRDLPLVSYKCAGALESFIGRTDHDEGSILASTVPVIDRLRHEGKRRSTRSSLSPSDPPKCDGPRSNGGLPCT